jgi:transcriptional regulator with XRE-family HTH domain
MEACMTPVELRARRMAMGYTQAQLAARIDLSRDYIGQMERGVAEITPRTAAAIRELRPSARHVEPVTRDPMERIVEQALIDAHVAYLPDQDGKSPSNLDFYLPDHDVHIEVKRFHSERIGAQMARAENVIAAQGKKAVELLATAIRGGLFMPLDASRPEA